MLTKSEKAEYDKKRYQKVKEKRKKQNREWMRRNYDPVRAAEIRKANKAIDVNYYSKIKYLENKRGYGKVYYAKKVFGLMWEHHLLIRQIINEGKNNGKTNGNKLKNCIMGNIKCG
jgi:hypothetical protein